MAITTTVQDVIDIAPELEGQETRIAIFVEQAKNDVSETIWGVKANFAVALLAAHMITMFSRGGIGGDIRRKRLGDEEIEYSSVSGSTSKDVHELSTTAYGKEFLRIRRTLVLTPTVAGC